MLSPKLQDALNEQMKNEFFSAYLYMAIAGYFQAEDLPGIASWMRVQALEEMTHGEKFYNFIADAAGRTDFRGFDAPKNVYESPLDAFKYSLKHENFVTEQVEEEASFSLNLRKLERIGNDGNGLLRLDDELAQRVFVPPTTAA